MIASAANFPEVDCDDPPIPEGYELVNGRLVEHHMGAEAGLVSGDLFAALRDYAHATGIGWALPPAGDFSYRYPGSSKTARKPDVSFVLRSRVPGGRVPKGDFHLVPDLAVEVVSPHDTVYALDEKVEEYLRVGVRLVWVVNPDTRTVLVHRPDGTVTKIRDSGELVGEDVLPGFRCAVTTFLPPPEVESHTG
jgi:Uma2 family endonuclease